MFEGPVQDLIDELGKLPGIGPKSAQRIAFHLLSVEPSEIDRLTAVLAKVRDGVRFCAVCGNVSDDERCRICADPRRDGSQVCVVEEPKDIQAVERTREFRGRYHVLGGFMTMVQVSAQARLSWSRRQSCRWFSTPLRTSRWEPARRGRPCCHCR